MVTKFSPGVKRGNDMERCNNDEGLAWQAGIWDKMSDVYLQEVDQRFVPVIEGVISRAAIGPGDHVLDLGTGTGSVALHLSPIVGDSGRVVASDISQDMLRIAARRAGDMQHSNIEFAEGGAESIPAEDSSFDVVLASLSLMYVIDRSAAAREIARVLRPGGRFVAAVWAAPDVCNIVLFQQTVGSFAPPPPVPGVGPGAMANLEPDVRKQARNAVRQLLWDDVSESRYFQNATQFIVGHA